MIGITLAKNISIFAITNNNEDKEYQWGRQISLSTFSDSYEREAQLIKFLSSTGIQTNSNIKSKVKYNPRQFAIQNIRVEQIALKWILFSCYKNT